MDENNFDIEREEEVVKARFMDYDGESDDYAKIVVTRDLIENDADEDEVISELAAHLKNAAREPPATA
jgi:hypothetical protein